MLPMKFHAFCCVRVGGACAFGVVTLEHYVQKCAMRVEPSVSPAASHMIASPVAQSYTPSANCISILRDADLLNDTQKIFSHALEDVQDLSSCAARRCEEARTLLDVSPDERPHEAVEELKEAHKYATQVVWQLRSIASDLDEALREIRDVEEEIEDQ